MPRLQQLGWGINSITNGAEFSTYVGTPSLTTTNPRTGTQAGLVSGFSAITRKYFAYTYSASNQTIVYCSVYVRFNTLPTAANRFFAVASGSATGFIAFLSVDNAGNVQLADSTGNIGSPTTVVTGQYYQFEIKTDITGGAGASIVEARIGNTVFATASNRTINGPDWIVMGANLNVENQTVGSWQFADMVVDTSAYPGPYKNITDFPAGPGDLTQWNIGGSSPAATNWQSLIDNPPDDAVSFVNSTSGATNTTGQEDLYTFTNPALASGDTVNYVALNSRHANNVSSANISYGLAVRKTSGGTEAVTTGINLSSVTWRNNATNLTSTIFNPMYISATDPDGAAWTGGTGGTIQTFQGGPKVTADTTTSDVQVTLMFRVTSYTPAAGTTTSTSFSTSSTSTSVSTSSTSTSISTSSTSTSHSTSTSSTSTSVSTSSTSTSISTSSTSASISTSSTSISQSTSTSSTSTSVSTSSTSTSVSTSSTSTSVSTSSTSTSVSISTSSTSISISTSSTSTSVSTSTSSTSTSTSISTSSTSTSISTSSTSTSISVSTSSTSTSTSVSTSSTSTSISTSSTSTSQSTSTSTSTSVSITTSTSSTSSSISTSSTSASISTSSTSTSTSQSTSTSSTSTSVSTSSTSTSVSITTSTSSTSSSTSISTSSTSTSTSISTSSTSTSHSTSSTSASTSISTSSTSTSTSMSTSSTSTSTSISTSSTSTSRSTSTSSTSTSTTQSTSTSSTSTSLSTSTTTALATTTSTSSTSISTSSTSSSTSSTTTLLDLLMIPRVRIQPDNSWTGVIPDRLRTQIKLRLR